MFRRGKEDMTSRLYKKHLILFFFLFIQQFNLKMNKKWGEMTLVLLNSKIVA
jgi:hypothetical protein